MLPVGAPSGFSSERPCSRAALSTASNAEVARRSCSSAPLIPDVGISRASRRFSSATDIPVPVWADAPSQRSMKGPYPRSDT